MSKYLHAAVICTRDRPNEVARLIDDLARQSRPPEQVIVVDAGNKDTFFNDSFLTNKPQSQPSRPFEVEIIRADPGLPRQRNLALKALGERAEFIHFFDDDVELDPNYLQEIAKEFEANPFLAGASGDVVNAHPVTPNFIQRILLLKSREGGVVLPSGVNIGMPGQRPSKKIMWLPGCAMSYRLSAVQNIWFDESRLGYALGEDVDFSSRVGLSATLAFVVSAKVRHNFVQSNRLQADQLAADDVLSRWSLASHLPYVNKWAVTYSTIGHAMVYYLTSFQSGASWQRSAATIRLKTLWALVTKSARPVPTRPIAS